MKTGFLLLTSIVYLHAAVPPAMQDAFRMGPANSIKAIAFDGAGNLFLAGTTPGLAGAPNRTVIGRALQQRLFVVKVAASRRDIAFATEIGSSGTDSFGAFAVDAEGNAYLSGFSPSSDFPVTPGALAASAEPGSSFVVKLDTAGKLAYSTYLDRSRHTRIRALAVNAAGRLYAAGSTDGLTFPTSEQAFLREVPADSDRDTNTVGFVAQLNAGGTGLTSSTLLGGTYGQDWIGAMAIAPDGTVHVAGNSKSRDFPVTAGFQCSGTCNNAFRAQFDPGVSRLLYSSLLAGNNAVGIAVDGQSNVWVVENVNDAIFVQHWDRRGVQGGEPGVVASRAEAVSIAALPNGHVVMAGNARACDFETVDAIMPCAANQPHDPGGAFSNMDVQPTAFLMEFDGAGKTVLSTPTGGLGTTVITTVAPDPKGGVLAGGFAQDGSFPGGETLIGSVDAGASFAFRLDVAGVTHGKPAPSRVMSAVTFAQRPLVPGSFATLFGSGLGPAAGERFQLTADARVLTELGGVQVTVAGVPAPVLYAQDRQINIAVPQSVSGAGDVCVIRESERACIFSYIAPYDASVFSVYPGIYAILNQDGSLNSPENPAARGSFLSVFGAGFGGYTRSFADGAITDLPLAYLARPVRAVFHDPRDNCRGIGGSCILYPTMEGEVSFSGAAPFAVNGLTQINIKSPEMPVGGTGKLTLSNEFTSTQVTVSLK